MALRLGVSEEGAGMPHGVWSSCTKDVRFILSKSIYVTCECIFVFYEYHTYIFQAPPSTLLWLTKFTNVFFQPLLERSRIKVIWCLNYHVIHILCESTQPYVARSLQQWLGRSLLEIHNPPPPALNIAPSHLLSISFPPSALPFWVVYLTCWQCWGWHGAAFSHPLPRNFHLSHNSI